MYKECKLCGITSNEVLCAVCGIFNSVLNGLKGSNWMIYKRVCTVYIRRVNE